MKPIDVMRQALDALVDPTTYEAKMEAALALRAAIAEMENAEPVAWMYEDNEDYHFTNSKSYSELFESIPLYTHPFIPEGWQLVPVEPEYGWTGSPKPGETE